MFRYGTKQYWEERYTADSEPFEWYQCYSTLRPFIRHLIQDDARVLIVGNGTSLLGEDLVDDGVPSVTCVDYSSAATTAMTRRGFPVKYETADVTNMPTIPSEQFDVVIDKACMDVMVCCPNGRALVERYLTEVSRVLAPNGLLMIITFAQPVHRIRFFSESAPITKFAIRTDWPKRFADSGSQQPTKTSKRQGAFQECERVVVRALPLKEDVQPEYYLYMLVKTEANAT